MTQPALDFTPAPSRLEDRVAAYLRLHVNEWVDGRVLATIGGYAAWRTRVSDLRTKRGMQIENRWRNVTDAQGHTYRLSEYKLCRGEGR